MFTQKSVSNLSTVLGRLAVDPGLRALYNIDPGSALRRIGVYLDEPEIIDLNNLLSQIADTKHVKRKAIRDLLSANDHIEV